MFDPGPWDVEPIFKQFEAFGLRCEVKRMPQGHLCGYVYLPPGHPLYGQTPDVSVHGGITYDQFDDNDEFWVLGFDCAHGGDLVPALRHRSGTYRTFAYVEAETISLASQIFVQGALVS